MDNYVIKLSGKAELPKTLNIGHNFEVELSGSIVSETIVDNDDGTKTHYFLFKPVIVETIDEKGERLRAKDTRSISRRIRSRCYVYWKEHLDKGKAQDEMYEWFGERAIMSFDDIMELLEREYGKVE